tara:strand:- start:992 stop:1144 length:153 start_codon:yes stop_codon:yes gene_type:complete
MLTNTYGLYNVEIINDDNRSGFPKKSDAYLRLFFMKNPPDGLVGTYSFSL